LAFLARAAVDEEARARGFKGAEAAQGNIYPYPSLPLLDDLRVGDVLAARLEQGKAMEGGVNNRSSLMSLTSVRDAGEISDKPLPNNVRDRVLEAWKSKRESAGKQYSQADLEAEIAIARKIRYDDFQFGPWYETVASLIGPNWRDLTKRPSGDAWEQEVKELPVAAMSDLWRVLQWQDILSPPPAVLQSLARWKDPRLFDYLLRIAYGEGFPDGNSIGEAIRLMAQLDYARAKPHIENFLTFPIEKGTWSREAPRLGAAIALAERGDKRGVAIIFSAEYEKRYEILNENIVGAALKTATGQDWPNLTQWRWWWQREGAKMRWE
jgi:hypothetical protein